jgi:prophage regulatory protein
MIDRFVRSHEVRAVRGRGKTSLYYDVKAGLFPKGISLGPRLLVWRESEVVAILNAVTRGASDDQIRELVVELENLREVAA